MPIRGLSNALQLAGIQFTAMHQTLGHFLDLSEKHLSADHITGPGTANSHRHATIALTTAQTHQTVAELLAVAESDPAILASMISFYGQVAIPATDWASAFSPAGLRVVGMTLATEQVAKYITPADRQSLEDNRKKAHLHGMLAHELANTLGSIDPVQAKVCGVLTGLPFLLCDVPAEILGETGETSKKGARFTDELAADLLSEWGLSPALSDVVRYQNYDLSALLDASELIRVVAYSGHLIPYVSGPDLVDSKLLTALNKLIKLDEETLYGIIGKAGVNYDRQERLSEQACTRDDGIQNFAGLDPDTKPTLKLLRQISNNAISATFHQFLHSTDTDLIAPGRQVIARRTNNSTDADTEIVLDKRILDVARYLFGITTICHFLPVVESGEPESVREATTLVGRLDNLTSKPSRQSETIEINITSQNSFIALAYQQQEMVNVLVEDVVTISERQLCKRFGNSGFVCIPLGKDVGVLVCSASAVASFGESDLDAPATAVSGSETSETALSKMTFSRTNSSRDSVLAGFISTVAAIYRKNLAISREAERLEVDYVKRRVSEVTHEVNNPLAIVQNYLRTLSLKLDEDAPVQSDIKTISDEILRVSKIVRKYADIGKKEDLLTEEVNVNQVLVRLLDVFRGGHDGVEITTTLDPGMPVIALSSDSLKQVIVNLIKNSIEAMAGQDVQVISVETHADINFGGTSYIEIVIADNGPGIPPEIRKKLFQPNNSGKSGRHSGLGLSIVNSLMENMQGMVSCRSQVEGEGQAGTVFQLLIPKVNAG